MRNLIFLAKIALIFGLMNFSVKGSAAEVSVVSGFLQNENYKTNNTDGGGKTSLSLGARYAEPLQTNVFWFGQSQLAIRTYDAPKGGKAPDNSIGLSLIGGLRWYFFEFSENVAPFMAASGGFVTDKNSDMVTETEKQGLYYYGHAGFRFEVDREFFLELETQVFESALFATEKTTPVDPAAGGTKTETTKIELYVSTPGGIASTTLGAGWKF